MRTRSEPVIGILVLTLALAGCATSAAGGGAATPGSSAGGTSSPPIPMPAEPTESTVKDSAAHQQARAWLDAAVLPPSAVPADAGVANFMSYTGWPCGPIEELEGFWRVPGETVSGVANWLRENPTADLLSTAGAPIPDDPAYDSASVGYIPAADSQEGIVYTIAKTADGVAVRAEVAALTATATCPELPDGGMFGAPGQG